MAVGDRGTDVVDSNRNSRPTHAWLMTNQADEARSCLEQDLKLLFDTTPFVTFLSCLVYLYYSNNLLLYSLPPPCTVHPLRNTLPLALAVACRARLSDAFRTRL